MTQRRMKYNPAFLTDEELIQSFVVRHADLKLIIQALRENVTESNQHVLVIGPRGIGKTMLVLRVVAEVRRDEELRRKWYPLVFAEESYEVTTPGEFWLEALFHLWQQTNDERWKRTYEELRREHDEARLRERALGQLMDFADSEGKRILLVVENLNMLLGDQISHDDAWVLRETLQHEPRVMLLASATTRFDEMENEGKAMFELFKPLSLKPLSEDECRDVWTSITGAAPTGRRIRPIQILTGGSPRLLTIIGAFGAGKSFKALMEDLTQLVDDHTEYFKTHLDNIPTTERKVYLALAEIWDPATARDIAEAARIDVNATSSLLKRLIGRGAVVVAGGRQRTQRYQVAERLYNIYYLMRRRGSPSSRVKAVVNFMVSFYGEEELIDITRRMAEEACGLDRQLRQDHYLALASIFGEVSVSLRARMLPKVPRKLLEADDAPTSFRQLAEEAASYLARRDDLRHSECGKELSAEQQKRQTPKQKKAVALVKRARELIGADHAGEAEKLYRQALELDSEYVPAYINLGVLLFEAPDRRDEAEAVFRKCVRLEPERGRTWTCLGILLGDDPNRVGDSEQVYRKAIEVEPDFATAWKCLGGLLHHRLERYEEAEQAYRKGIELEPGDALVWFSLAVLLHERLGRYEEAEKAYRKAIELKPDDAQAWGQLGVLLDRRFERFEEAEDAYRAAIQHGSQSSTTWDGLLHLLLLRGKRVHEALSLAEECLAKCPDDAELLNVLAWAIYSAEAKEAMGQAEALARKAVSVSPGNPFCQYTYACILCALNRSAEALAPAKRYLDDTKVVEKTLNDAIELVVQLAAAGAAREALDLLVDSASVHLLEPLVAGLKLFLGEEVKAAAEILEVGEDVKARIEERRKKLLAT